MREGHVFAGILESEARYLPARARARDDGDELRAHRLSAVATVGVLDHFHYGAFVVGPVLTTFAEWVVADCAARRQARVWCLMREGKLLAPLVAAAARAAGVTLEARPLWASRFVNRAAGATEATPAVVGQLVAKRTAPGLASVARDLGVDEATLRRASKIAHDRPITRAERRRIAHAVADSRALAAQLLAQAAEKRERYLRYLRAEGVLGDRDVTLVDLGWGGTMQDGLAHIVEGHGPEHVRGLYLATHSRVLQLPTTCSAASFLWHGEPVRGLWALVMRSPEILELSCTSREGSLASVDETGAPELFPQLLSDAQLAQIDEVQAGVRHFAELWLAGASRRRARLAPGETDTLAARVRAILGRAIHDPTAEEVRLFDGWEQDENDGTLLRESLVGGPELRARARRMSYGRIMTLSGAEAYWPAALARAVDKTPKAGPAAPTEAVWTRVRRRLFGAPR